MGYHPIVKNCAVYSLVDRTLVVCSSDFELKTELDHIKDLLIGNGYPKQVIDKVIDSIMIYRKTKSTALKSEENKLFVVTLY